MNDNGPQLYLKCEWCSCMFEYNGGKRKRFCSDAHKQAAWRATKQPVAEINGIHIVADPDVPDGEIRVVQPEDMPD